MTTRRAGTVVIRLDLRGQEELERRIKELGPLGERLGRDLSKAMVPVQREGRLAKATLLELGDAVEDVAREAGPLGRVLTALGPVGLAGAAGLGALALALRETFVLMERARLTTEFASEIESISNITGIAADSVLVFRDSVRLARGDVGQADRALEDFARRLGEFRALGTGEAAEGLRALGLEALGQANLPIEDALDQVLDRLVEITDPSVRLSLADKLGLVDAAPLLQRTGDEIARIREEAEGANRAFSEGELARFAQAGDEIAGLQLRRDRAQQIQSFALLDAEIRRQRILTGFEERKAAALAYQIPLSERSLEVLTLQSGEIEAQIDLLEQQAGSMAGAVTDIQQSFVELENLRRTHHEINEALIERQRILDLSSRAESDLAESWVRALSEFPDLDPGVSAERRTELEALIEARVRGLMSPSEQLAELETDLQAARRAGLDITDRQIAAILEQERVQLGVLNAVERELAIRQDILDHGVPVPRLRPAKPDTDPQEEGGRLNPLGGRKYDDAKREEMERAGSLALKRLRVLRDESADLARQMDDLVTTSLYALGDGLQDIITQSESVGEAFEGMARRMIAAMTEIALQRYVLGPIADAVLGPLEGFLGGSTKIGASKLPGFDRGFNGVIHGAPGIDNNVLALNGQPFARVSDGENLMITPRLGQGGGGGVTVNVHNAPPGTEIRRSQGLSGPQIDVILKRAQLAGAQAGADAGAAAASEIAKSSRKGATSVIRQQQILEG